ncbi:MAG: hypothetical protein JNK38_26635, partial [Acidobacteria bacterium]|nr:hypothetical protein [Acidobacteriota bacterium]
MKNWLNIWGRRAVTIVGYTLAWAIVLLTLPLTLALAVVVDLIRRNRFATVRAVLMAAVFLTCEMVG